MTDVHALVVPGPAEGHINGLLCLAQALVSHGLLVTFGYPARAHSLRRNASKIHPAIRVEIIPDGLPTDESQLPSHQEMMASVSIMQNALLLLAEKLLAGPLPISYIISDTLSPWTRQLSDKVGLPRIDCWTSNATAYSMGFHLTELISRGFLPIKGAQDHWNLKTPTVDCIPGLAAFPISELPREFLVDDLSYPHFQFVIQAFSGARDAHTILVYSLYELESEVIDALRADQIPVCAICPLFDLGNPRGKLSCKEAAIPMTSDSAEEYCLKWLDQQLAASVVYVAFGTMATLSLEQNRELALGLEASGHPFMWVIRADFIQGELSKTLPEGFLSRIANRGLIVPWAPQRDVLQHTSVGAFFTHCGWNSTLESVWAGKPMVACPLMAEQRSNARKVVDEWKVGVELQREDDWSFSKEAVSEGVKAIMANRGVQQRAQELKHLVRQSVGEGGSSHRSLLDFVHDLKKQPRSEYIPTF